MAQAQPPAKRTEQAMTIRKYLESEETKKQVRMAIPKFMDAERLLRVAYTSITKNPQLLECTMESLLSAVIQCAQLGLEPVLGRAHLVPYWNNQKRCLEAQFQPGYQGLIELCRRSGEIADVWAEVIKEKDEWHVEFGLNRNLMHRPNFDVDDRGKAVGAYAVFQHKDGTKGWSFLPIAKIYSQHRAKSKAYENAVKKKRTDTPWIEDEDEMIKKTMIKLQSKMEPVSIEVQAAIAMDTATELGQSTRQAWNSFMGFGDPELPQPTDGDKSAQFDELAQSLQNQEKVADFVQHCAEHFESTVEEVKAQAVEEWDEFVEGYNGWLEKQEEDEKGDKDKGDDQKLPCPWPDCDFEAKNERGLKKHNTQQHDGKRPEDVSEEPPPSTTTQEEKSPTGEAESQPGDQESGESEPEWYSQFLKRYNQVREMIQEVYKEETDDKISEVLENHNLTGLDELIMKPGGQQISETLILRFRSLL